MPYFRGVAEIARILLAQRLDNNYPDTKINRMKIFISISIAMLLVTGTLSMANARKGQPQVTTTAHDNLFVLKASRGCKGAEIEVLSASGYLVTSKKLIRRKMVIDFKNVVPGWYMIRLKKSGVNEEFKFQKI